MMSSTPAKNGITLKITAYNMTARPASDYANITMNLFNTSLSKGSILVNFTANATDTVIFNVWSLVPGSSYLIKKDNSSFTMVQADTTGKIVFNNSIW